ncbi:MAG: hypothetical protein Q8R12_00385 [bacterium]|nr:hypothetical protein [bacterium]
MKKKFFKPISLVLIFALSLEISFLAPLSSSAAINPSETLPESPVSKPSASSPAAPGAALLLDALSNIGGGECYQIKNPENRAIGNNLWAPCCNCCIKGGGKSFVIQGFDPNTGSPLPGGQQFNTSELVVSDIDVIKGRSGGISLNGAGPPEAVAPVAGQVLGATSEGFLGSLEQGAKNIGEAVKSVTGALSDVQQSARFGIRDAFSQAGLSPNLDSTVGLAGQSLILSAFSGNFSQNALLSAGGTLAGGILGSAIGSGAVTSITGARSALSAIGETELSFVGDHLSDLPQESLSTVFNAIGAETGAQLGTLLGNSAGAIASGNPLLMGGAALNILSKGLPVIGGTLGEFGSAVGGAVKAISDTFSSIGGAISGALTEALGPIGSALSNIPVIPVISNLASGNVLGALGSAASGIFSKGLEAIGLSAGAFTGVISSIFSFAQGNVAGGATQLGGVIIGAIAGGPIGAVVGGIVGAIGSLFGGKKCKPAGCLNAVCKNGNAIWDPATGICGCDQGASLSFLSLLKDNFEETRDEIVQERLGISDASDAALQGIDDLPYDPDLEEPLFGDFNPDVITKVETGSITAVEFDKLRAQLGEDIKGLGPSAQIKQTNIILVDEETFNQIYDETFPGFLDQTKDKKVQDLVKEGRIKPGDASEFRKFIQSDTGSDFHAGLTSSSEDVQAIIVCTHCATRSVYGGSPMSETIIHEVAHGAIEKKFGQFVGDKESIAIFDEAKKLGGASFSRPYAGTDPAEMLAETTTAYTASGGTFRPPSAPLGTPAGDNWDRQLNWLKINGFILYEVF